MIIYKTTNLINGKIYIGKDKYNNDKYLGSGKILKQAITKYGRENFIKEVIEICEDEKTWIEREVYWISYFNSIKGGYNIALGGLGGDTISNNPNREEIRKRHSEKMKDPKVNKRKAKGRVVKPKKKDDPNWINPQKGKPSPLRGRPSNKKGVKNPKHSEWMKQNNPMKGKTHTDDVKDLLRKINSKPKSDEHKQKISETLKGHKPVNMVAVEIEHIVYESLTHAAIKTGINMSTLRNRIKSKSEKYKNYKLCKIDY